MPDLKEEIRKNVEAEFAELEAQLASTNPGVGEFLKVFGDYDQAVQDAEAYLSMLSPDLGSYASNNSNT